MMNHSPISDRTLGIIIPQHPAEDKFRDIRQRAHEELIERKRKAKRDKHTPIPEFKIGQEVVLTGYGYHSKQYILVECIDIVEDDWREQFDYFGLVRKVSYPKWVHRIGHICAFAGVYSWNHFQAANVDSDSIKWLAD